MPEPVLDRFRARNIGYLLQGGQLIEPLASLDPEAANDLLGFLLGL